MMLDNIGRPTLFSALLLGVGYLLIPLGVLACWLICINVQMKISVFVGTKKELGLTDVVQQTVHTAVDSKPIDHQKNNLSFKR